MVNPRILRLLFALAAAGALVHAVNRQQASFDVAIYTGHAFELYNADTGTGAILTCQVPVGDFSVAPNGRFIVLSSNISRPGMGFLYRLDLQNGHVRPLPSRPFYFTDREPYERELYSDPAVSPDSHSVAFTPHTVGDNDGDDAIGLAGPLAVIDLGTGARRVLPATRDIDGNGPAYVNTPVWSADGRRVLIAFEDGGAIADRRPGHKLQRIQPWVSKRFDEGVISPLTWWSDHEVLIARSAEGGGARELYILDVRDGAITDAAPALHLPAESLREVSGVQVNGRFILLQHRGSTELYSRRGERLHRWTKGAVRLRLYN